MSPSLKRNLFVLFLASGFCGLVYQIVWVRLALAAFGVITPVVSVVVSVFMLGLSLGSWLGGRWIRRVSQKTGVSALIFYAIAEGIIAVGSIALPSLFEFGRELLLPVGGMGSGAYLALSAGFITMAMLPWCFCMGATYPLVLQFVEEVGARDETTFSFLYLANVVGAMCGAIFTSVAFIELFGFDITLAIAGTTNLAVAAAAVAIARKHPSAPRPAATATTPEPRQTEHRAWTREFRTPAVVYGLLFTTGFTSMALEIVWMRAFTPVLGTLVYAFAGLLTVYLLATWTGSLLYRRGLARLSQSQLGPMLTLTAIAAIVPSLASDPRAIGFVQWATGGVPVDAFAIPMVLASIFPFCALLGYMTPMLIDRATSGEASRAGLAYAINIVGSIFGPLAAAYLLLPWLGSRLSMLILAAPFFAILPWFLMRLRGSARVATALAATLTAVLAILFSGFHGISYEEGSHLPGSVVRRDHTATVISFGEGLKSHLVVNGHGMTTLSALTKVMAHLPLVTLEREPESALVIALGMGTTYRSLLTWDIQVTAVELVPSVVDAFDYYFPDAKRVRANPRGRIVVDDGRRFLARTGERYDLITIDPPPPVEAAGSSLLYAREFYALARSRLAPGGILHHWFPDSPRVEPLIRQAALRVAFDSFRHVRIFYPIQGTGLHILCSDEPLSVPDADTFAEALPRKAKRDLMEWAPLSMKLEDFIQERILDKEIDPSTVLDPNFELAITDDRPLNEYFALRRLAALLGRRP